MMPSHSHVFLVFPHALTALSCAPLACLTAIPPRAQKRVPYAPEVVVYIWVGMISNAWSAELVSPFNFARLLIDYLTEYV